ncbi:MAG: peptidylprolyl isomerase [Prevotella sp.]|nr:peptidylprolyl isomerase [Prevotella sp.]
MKKTKLITLGLAAMLPLMGIVAQRNVPDDDPTQKSVIDEVVWVVGDEPILKSEVEGLRLQAEMEGIRWGGNPDCAIPERIAVEKLFLHQAAIDSIEVTESEISSNIDQRMEFFIQQAGSREKLEEWRGQTVAQMRAQMHDELRNQMLIQRMREKLVEDITVSPAEVRRYFSTLSPDSVPFVPTEVEVQIITRMPKIEQEEINRIKDELREYTNRVTAGETTFQTLARMYSEDPGSARYGGELGFVGRGTLDPAFAAAAFNLTDPKKLSKIVESEFGYHIIQLVEKRGDKINVRHILRKPRVSDAAIDSALIMLDSLAVSLRQEKFTFDEAASLLSDDKDTRNNHGLMANATDDGRRTSKFRMQDLPTEVARAVEKLQPGEVSPAFKMVNQRGKTVCAIVKLKSRVDGHRATITEDFQVMKNVVQEKRRNEVLNKWVEDKIKTIYVRVNDRYKDCQFEHQGWIK